MHPVHNPPRMLMPLPTPKLPKSGIEKWMAPAASALRVRSFPAKMVPQADDAADSAQEEARSTTEADTANPQDHQ
jgi:hypothetical protein